MANPKRDTFTKDERATIFEYIDALEQMRLLGGESVTFDESGAESIHVMPLDDGPARYVITKRDGRFHMVDGDGLGVVDSERLADVLAALP